MTSPRKPNAFIGCSREAIAYARAVSAHLERDVQVNPWYAGTFGANDYTMEALEREVGANDFGIFVFAPDDVALIRNKYVFVTRDNTLFEMGLFWGRLGRRRVFGIVPREVQAREDLIREETVSEFHLLSDLSGLTLLQYGLRSDGKYMAAVDTACAEILRVIRSEGLFEDPSERLRREGSLLERKESILHFFWEYNKTLHQADPEQRYTSFCEGVRNAFLPPAGFRITGAAIWKQVDEHHIGQVGGNVGRGRLYSRQANEGKSGDQKVYVLDVLNSGEWTFFTRKEIAEVYVLCYPLGKKHVLSVHLSGNRTLSAAELTLAVADNEDLLSTHQILIGRETK